MQKSVSPTGLCRARRSSSFNALVFRRFFWKKLCRRVAPSTAGQILQAGQFDLDLGSRSPQQVIFVFESLDTAQTAAFEVPGPKIEDVRARTCIIIRYETELDPIT